MSFEKVKIMGVLNVTPDSFSDGGEYFSKARAVERALEMEREGADLIDIGGESTRPGAMPVLEEEELERVLPVIREIRSRIQIPISIDTTKPAVARAALEAGAEIINDVDGMNAASEMAGLARDFEAGLVLMHRRGSPETMQQMTQYEDVTQEVFEELDRSLEQVLDLGIACEQVVMDPGIGFAKNAGQNVELIVNLKRFHSWGRPILVGPSRKSFIGDLIGKAPDERDWGSASAVALAVAQGARLVRVHHVAAMRDVVRVAEAIANGGVRTHVGS